MNALVKEHPSSFEKNNVQSFKIVHIAVVDGGFAIVNQIKTQ
jgi:hypothetical protein